jgi:hypothetical protein
MRCAGCRYAMRAERRRQARGDVWVFSCRSVNGAHAWTCGAPARITITDEDERAIVRTFLDVVPEFAARVRRAAPALDEAMTALEAARRAFEQWRDDPRVQVRLGMDAYLEGVAARQQQLTSALARVAQEEAKSDAIHLPPRLTDLRERWDDLTPRERRELLHAAVLCVLTVRVERSSDAPLAERVRVVWRGCPLELPRKGHVPWSPLSPVGPDQLDDEPWVSRVAPAED